MPFYFLTIRPLVNDITRVLCIELAGNQNGRKLQDLSDVRSVNDLMVKKAMPIRNVAYQYTKEIKPGTVQAGGGGSRCVPRDELLEGPPDETLGEALNRVKQARLAIMAAEKQKVVKNMIQNRLKKNRTQKRLSSQDDNSSSSSQDSSLLDFQPSKLRKNTDTTQQDSVTSFSETGSEVDHSGTLSGTDYQQFIFVDDRNETQREKDSLSSAEIVFLSEIFEKESKHAGTSHQSSKEKDNEEYEDCDVYSHVLSEVEEGDEDVSTVVSHASTLESPIQGSGRVESQNNNPPSASKSHQLDVEDRPATCFTKISSASSIPSNSNSKKKHNLTHCKSCLKVKSQEESLQLSFDQQQEQDSDHPWRQFAPEFTHRHSRRNGEPNENESIWSQHNFRLKTSLYWGHVEQREYKICMGDNPACTKGPPIQIDWKYETTLTTTVHSYEDKRSPRCTTRFVGARRLRSDTREKLLKACGYTDKEIAAAVQRNIRAQKQRIQTVARLKRMNFDERLENFSRILPFKTL